METLSHRARRSSTNSVAGRMPGQLLNVLMLRPCSLLIVYDLE